MLLNHEKTAPVNYLENWPEHYYDIKDIDEREALLLQVLNDHPESKEDQRRLLLRRKRYPDKKLPNGVRKDNFIPSWMTILIEGRTNLHFYNRRRIEQEIRRCFTALCVLEDTPDPVLLNEWRQFAHLWITTCVNDRNYQATAFGMFRMKDQTLARKIAAEINEVTRVIPAKFGIEKEVGPFREIMRHAYINMIENGDQYWQDFIGY